ncbi:MAG: hypothetical protein QM608_18935 [Caulobacter sp.]
MTLAAVAVFYVVVGGLWATTYFPLKEHYKQHDVMRSIVLSSKDLNWSEDPKYQKADDYVTAYALTHPSLDVIESRIVLYETILLWGTVALAVGGAVLLLTRGKPRGKKPFAPGDAA